MNKKTVRDIDLEGKKVLVRCDFNVPLDKDNPNITISELIEDVLVNKFSMTHEELATIKNNLLED